jgi:hypothetical protein
MSRRSSPSQACKRRISRSRSERADRAAATASLVASPSPRAEAAISPVKRSVSASWRRELRCRFRRTLRATPNSQGRASLGTSSIRRQATRNVSATMSSASTGDRRYAYRRIASKCCSLSRLNRCSVVSIGRSSPFTFGGRHSNLSGTSSLISGEIVGGQRAMAGHERSARPATLGR